MGETTIYYAQEFMTMKLDGEQKREFVFAL